MTDRVRKNSKIRRTLPTGVSWFLGTVAFAILLTACGGGGEDIQPPLTPAASLTGVVAFTAQVSLAAPPGDEQADGIRFAARIVDPGDDIGRVPLPRPSTLRTTGEYAFTTLDPNPLVYFNLLFIVDDSLQSGGSGTTPVGFNIPVSLADAVSSLLSVTVDRPSKSVLEMGYSYLGPDGTREVRLRLDFSTDLLTFDLDGDGLFDDLIAIDANHDAINDSLAPALIDLDYRNAVQSLGTVSALGANSISVGGKSFEITGITNIDDSATGKPLSVSDISIGGGVTVHGVGWDGKNIAVAVDVMPDPAKPQTVLEVHRAGIVEQMDPDTIFVAGVLFRGWRDSEIVDSLDQPISASELSIGKYATITGIHDGPTIRATSIQIQEVSPPPAYFEREGTIESLDPPGAPTTMTLAGLTFQLPGATVIRDLDGRALDRSALKIGSPAWVYAHLAGSDFVADTIELQFTVEPPNGKKIEVVVLVDDPAIMPDIQAAVDLHASSVPVAIVPVANEATYHGDPPCLEPVFGELPNVRTFVKSLPVKGPIDVYARAVSGECSVLMVVNDADVHIVDWLKVFFPQGVGGAPIQYERALVPPVYGLGQEYDEALKVVDWLGPFWANDAVKSIYISPDQDFSG